MSRSKPCACQNACASSSSMHTREDHGEHARVDAYLSLAVIASAIAIAAGAPILDPAIGLGLHQLSAAAAMKQASPRPQPMAGA